MRRHPRGQTVSHLRPAGITRNAHGAAVPTWAAPVAISGVAVAPITIQDPRTGTPYTLVQGLTIYLPSGMTVTSEDRFVIDGNLFEVDGDPGEWDNPFTTHSPGTEVRLRRITSSGAGHD